MSFRLTLGCFVEKVKEERGNISRKALHHLLELILECLNSIIYSEEAIGKPSLA